MNYTEGKQPCTDYSPTLDHCRPNVHECPGPHVDGKSLRQCRGLVSFCESCNHDHHEGGWENCGVVADEDKGEP